MIKEFLNEMHKFVPKEAAVMLCQFRGGPADDVKGKWVAKPLRAVSQIDGAANVYLTVAAMKVNARGEFRRRKENFAGGLLLMIDDLGTGPGSKFPLSTIDALKPTALIETSPDNFQAVYMFDSLIEDIQKFNALIKAFIAKQFLGSDTGMAGVNRVFRPPAGINGKPKYGGWDVKLSSWDPGNRYSIEDIAAAFDLTLEQKRPRMPRGATASKSGNIRAFIGVRTALRNAGMLKNNGTNMEGWIDVECPWTGDHTGAANNGAAIREPAPENEFFGAFRCHHGGCIDKGWRQLTEWLAGEHEVILDQINTNAPEAMV